MSDELEIRSGGAISVDTATLRRAAEELQVLADDCRRLAALLWAAADASLAAGVWHPAPDAGARAARERAEELAAGLRHRAAVYELVEQDAGERAARAGTTSALTAEARAVAERWRATRHAELERQIIAGWWMLGSATPLLLAGTGAIRGLDRGALPAGAPALSGRAEPVTVRERARTPATAPIGLVELADRIPSGEDERVRVETYEMADGRREYAVYITGTRAVADADEPWDMTSNLQLYFGQRSSSFDAVERAVAASGAVAGDRLHIVGHSQGGMLATHLARQGGFEVATLVTFASPVQAALPGDTLTVAVRHTDDPVAALAAGGLAGIAGSPQSLVVERVADPVARPGDVALDVHALTSYRDTAARADSSDDPRIGALHAHLAGLGAATAVTAVTYSARREKPASDDRRRR